MNTRITEAQLPPLPEPAWWLSHDVLTKRNRIDKMPVQSLQPGAYQHTKLYAADQLQAYALEAVTQWQAQQEAAPAVAEPSTPPAMERGIHPSELLIATWPPTPKAGMIVGMSKGVKITHRSTGTTVTCDTERSQHLNRDKAWEMLRAALAAQPEPAAQDKEDAERYRWLRDAPVDVPAHGVDVAFWEDDAGEAIRGEQLDSAIDAAKKSGGQT